jgi:hypothetical protein
MDEAYIEGLIRANDAIVKNAERDDERQIERFDD